MMNKEGKAYTDAEWEIHYVPTGRVDYDALMDAKTVDGCKKYSSFMGVGTPAELVMRQYTCACAVCVKAIIEMKKSWTGCAQEQWLASPKCVTMKPKAVADAAQLRSDTLMTVDEYTSKIPNECNIAISCGTDLAGHNVWFAKTRGTMRVVVEPFEDAGVQYSRGDKYFVVNYYTSVKKDDKQGPSVDNVVLNRYIKEGCRGIVFNHLVLPHYGFDMPFIARAQGRATHYSLLDEDRERISHLIEGATTGRF